MPKSCDVSYIWMRILEKTTSGGSKNDPHSVMPRENVDTNRCVLREWKEKIASNAIHVLRERLTGLTWHDELTLLH